jgi:hypothetical protein
VTEDACERAYPDRAYLGYRFTDEVDPDDPHNAVIVDIEHGPKNANGAVSFTADFQIIKPTNLTNSAHRVIYDLPNRGNAGALGTLNGGSAVRGGGHNVAGNAVCNGGLMIDLSAMRSVRVDPLQTTARAEAGATWGEFDRETQAFGLATPGGQISTTGVAGLTLGGGWGHLARRYGLASDNLISADLVTVDGNFLTVSGTQHPDLFWACGVAVVILVSLPLLSTGCIRLGLFWLGSWPTQWRRQERPSASSVISPLTLLTNWPPISSSSPCRMGHPLSEWSSATPGRPRTATESSGPSRH